jgi:hypothetical protein
MGDETAHLKKKAPTGVGPRERGSLKVPKTSADASATGNSAQSSSTRDLRNSSSWSRASVEGASSAEASEHPRVGGGTIPIEDERAHQQPQPNDDDLSDY